MGVWRCLAAALLCALPLQNAGAEIRGFDDDLSPATTNLIVDVDGCSGAASIPPEFASCPAQPNPVNTVFSVGFTSGYAFIGDVLYGLNWSGSDILLHTMANSFCATGTVVGAAPIGFLELESLAACPDGFLYSADFKFTLPHEGRLIRIDPGTGLGTAIGGPMADDVRVVGMSCDQTTGVLWAVTSGYATRPSPELFTIDPATGQETLVGPLGILADGVQSLTLHSASPARLVGAGAQLHEIDPETGSASPLGGSYLGTLWALASRSPGTLLADGPCGDLDDSGRVGALDLGAYRDFLADPVGSPLPPGGESRCTVTGSPRPCDILDVVIMRRSLECPALAPGIQQVCDAAN